jgi:hypothetical protein
VDEIKLAILFCLVLHAAEVFLHEGRSKWPCKTAWKEAAIPAKVKLLLKLMAWTAIKFAPFVYYSMTLYDHM